MTPERDDRLRNVEDRLLTQTEGLKVMALDVTEIRKEIAEQTSTLKTMIEPIGEAVMGTNSAPGLRERVRMLETARQNSRWMIGLLVSAVVPLVLEQLFALLRHTQ